MGGSGGEGTPPDFPGAPLERASKLDLLLVVDNSITMGPKSEILVHGLPTFLRRLASPNCVGSGRVVVEPDPEAACPAGTAREFSPLTDVHVGVISTSLGAHGGQVCAEGGDDDDHGRLIPTVRDVPGLPSSGFSTWTGTGSLDAFVSEIEETVRAVGSSGCGYEAQLESWYRFLIDPEPPLAVAPMGGGPMGIDETVLAQRAAFLRPDSALAILLLTDENDCSIRDEGQGWVAGLQTIGTEPFRFPPATSACETDPNSVCCRSCASAESAPPPGCTALRDDVACSVGSLSITEDNANLRCWDQKRRFGIDFLYPTSRYVRALTSPVVVGASGQSYPNPLFVEFEGKSRRPSLVRFAGIVGVPWQDVATEASLDSEGLTLLSASELVAEGRWPLMTKSSSTDQPNDPFMIESTAARSGEHPLTGDDIQPIGSATPNAINGHETNITDGTTLQTACLFERQDPVECTDLDPGCGCSLSNQAYQAAYCRPPGGGVAGTTQYFELVYPGLRELEVLRGIGDSAVVGSTCAKVVDPQHPDHGYAPALRALGDRLAETLE